MPDAETLKQYALLFGLTTGGLFLLVVGFCIALWLYPRFKLIVGDIAKVASKASKWIRKKAIESEIEGSINLFTRDFNSELIDPIFPECSVEWVTSKNAKTSLEPGRAIVRLSLGEDHDLNLYNAARVFVEVSLLPRTKPFLVKYAARALDQFMLKNLLSKAHRRALIVFNNRFRDEDDQMRGRFHQYEETDQEGLFKRILLQEYHFLGEMLGDKTPKDEYQTEFEKFWEWFYELATREPEEISELAFRSEHINMGVVLIAQSETYERYGITPYIRRAYSYASNDCNCLYLLSRGAEKGKIALEIANSLEATEGFENITKKPQFKVQQRQDYPPLLITCIAFRPSKAAILKNTWDRLRQAMEKQEEIQACVREVSRENIEVDIYGLRIPIERGYLTALDIPDASRYFHVNEDLFLKVLACAEDRNYVLLSNVDTGTDPKRLVDEFDKREDEPVTGTIERTRETGLIIEFPGKELRGYIPRRFATYSRFTHLSDQYLEGETISVQLHGFDPNHKTFICRAGELRDPWDNIDKYTIGQVVSGTVHQISSRYIICEIEPGLEASIPFAEVAWGSEEKKESALRSHNIGGTIEGKIIDIDEARKQLLLSPKRLTESPVEKFFRAYDGKNVKGEVMQVNQNSAVLELGAEKVEGYLHVSEFMWCYCSDMSKHLENGDEIHVRILCHDPIHDNIKVSVKQLHPSKFDEFVDALGIGDTVKGAAKCIDMDRAIVSVKFGEDQYIEAYVHKSEVSNVCFVDELFMSKILYPNEEYDFLIKRTDPRFKIVELSRKGFLRKKLDNIAYGKTYSARIIGNVGDRIYLHGENLEGFLLSGGLRSPTPGKIITVIPARIDLDGNKLEFFAAE